ncbi:insulinase family protein [candidate division KSB1 bacterium]|nr:insulinase family protein [candidate division KSB1 bacterium]NIR73251.1 insulinase family protein [candidate division KSB1 bacterium]NIS26957.1 insulinase family protein [candidate division KSB1 bacterium]NIT73795.1 insulinase family protein [candidate division KSB1 bacterium]NIU27701.1 insulinase family protein [candidate division KSB1 bacterium]
MKKSQLLVALLGVLILLKGSVAQNSKLKIDYEEYTLDNGLEVILHEDRSDPITSVAVLYHVGSNREVKGRTGFAHLFEHMMFQESQHVGQDQFFKKIQDAGGTLNGFTFEDGTGYFEIVPKNALEMALWLESDRMGWLLSTVTSEAFRNQQDVVQNEKRQRVDNRPYGHTNYVIHKLLYPENHPYNWQVIGSLEDLQNANLHDVRNFFKKWYGPNNATLVIAGDFDVQQTQQWVEKYFGEIKARPEVPEPEVRRVSLSETKRAYHEDNFAKSPELNMVFPTIEEYSKDAYALDLLADLLADGKKAPLYKVIVEGKKLAPSVSAWQNDMEITGDFRIRIRAFPKKPLNEVEQGIFEALTKFEEDGFNDEDLARIKAKTETNFYNSISSILNKSFRLAFYNEYAGSADFIELDLQNILEVTKEDIWRVYNTYIKDKPYVLTSFVPKGQTELIAENSEKFPVVEEDIAAETDEPELEKSELTVEKIPSEFDRRVEPPKGPAPVLSLPEIWQHEYNNGLKILGIEHDELPLVNFSITLKGGLLLDDPNKVGVANLMTDIMMEGTKNKTPIELEEAIDNLGANISMFTTRESIVIRANALSSKFDEVYALVEEILLEPRWDEKEFERIKRETIENINRRNVRPSIIATNVFNKLVYSEDHILANSTLGTQESVENITIDDLKKFYADHYSPSISHVSMVGNISKDQATTAFQSLEEKWPAKEVEFPEYPDPPVIEQARVYFVDVPNAKQSQIRIGYTALKYTDEDYFPATVMNYRLGGSFNGILNLILREEKGYTYGARSRFQESNYRAPFVASAAVKSNTTFESMKIFKEEMTKYRNGIPEEDLAFTKNALIKSNARRFETFSALTGVLNDIAMYDLPTDYIKQQEAIIQNMTLEQHKQLASQYIVPDKMVYLVVGDAETQLEPLQKLGFGDPIRLNKKGNVLMAGEDTTMNWHD